MKRNCLLIALVTVLSSLAFGGAASAQSPGAYFDGGIVQTINPAQCIGGAGVINIPIRLSDGDFGARKGGAAGVSDGPAKRGSEGLAPPRACHSEGNNKLH